MSSNHVPSDVQSLPSSAARALTVAQVCQRLQLSRPERHGAHSLRANPRDQSWSNSGESASSHLNVYWHHLQAVASEARRTAPTSDAGKYQVFPSHAKAEFEKLKRSDREGRCLRPVVVDQRGNIIDGHHRVQAWDELRAEGVKVPTTRGAFDHLVER